MRGGRLLGIGLAWSADAVERAGESCVGQGLPRRQLHPSQKGGRAVGKTKRGKGTKLMLAADGNGLPIGFELAGANHHEVKLAVGTLETVRVPRRGRGRPKQRPEEVVAYFRPTTAGASGNGCARRASGRRSPLTSGARGSAPSWGVR